MVDVGGIFILPILALRIAGAARDANQIRDYFLMLFFARRSAKKAALSEAAARLQKRCTVLMRIPGPRWI